MDIGHYYADKELKALQKEFRTQYKMAADELQTKFGEYLRQYDAEDNEKKRLMLDGKITKDDYRAWRIQKLTLSERWTRMIEQLSIDITQANKKAAMAINGHLSGVYIENNTYAKYVVDKGTSIGNSFTLLDERTVSRLIKDRPHLLPTIRVNELKDKRWNQKNITSAVTQGILQGESIPRLASRLQSVADMNEYAAIRNARTAVTCAENVGRLDGFREAKNLGIDIKKQWMATHDGRTRHSHRMLDMEVVDIDEPFSNKLMEPGDTNGRPEEIYNCRCRMVAVIDGKQLDTTGDIEDYETWKNAMENKSTIDRMYGGTEIKKDDAIKAFRNWADGEAYDIRFSQQMGNDSNEAKYMERLIKESNIHYSGDLYRGIIADEAMSRELLDILDGEAQDNVFEFGMLGTSSWSTKKDIADDFSKYADKIGGLDIEKGIPVVFHIKLPPNDYAIDIDEFAGLGQGEVIVSKNTRFFGEHIQQRTDGTIDVWLDIL